MADTRLSKVGVTVKEPWAVDISYEALDMTLFAVEDGGDGCSYVALKDNIGVTPGTDPTTWVKSTQAGQSIYDLAVKYKHFEGTEEEFEAEYQAVLQAAREAAAGASAVEAQVEAAEALRVSAEASRVSAESARQSAEASRASAETARGTAEAARQSAESGRASAESARATAESARATAETARASAESTRQSNETARTQRFGALETDMETAIAAADAATAAAVAINTQIQTAEEGRVSAEQGRVSAETARASAESARATAETSRATAETARATAEEQRATAEGQRVTAENARVSAESSRDTAESARVTAEASRVTAETARESQASSDHTRAESDHAIAAEDHATLDEKFAHKADIDGWYGGLTSGAAENLVGRGTTEAEYVNRRTSAGTADIGSGSAAITRIKGRSVVWNQRVDIPTQSYSKTANNVTITDNRDGTYSVQTTAEGALANVNTSSLPSTTSLILGHKYFVKGCPTGGSDTTYRLRFTSGNVSEVGTGSIFTNASGTIYNLTVSVLSGAIITTPILFRPQLFDLTLLGIDNLTTVEEVEAWLAENIGPLDYYAYNPGEVINNAAEGIKTRGFNLFNYETGKAYLPGKYSDYPYECEICGTFTSISFTDVNGNTSVPELHEGRFFNVDAPGELTVVGGNNTDTLVHLVWSGWRNEGEPDYVYEPYWESTLNLGLTSLTGKLNGQGSSVVVFPHGLAKVGDVQDEIVGNRAIKRVGVVDLGTLKWLKLQDGDYFFADGVVDNVNVATIAPNALCPNYTPTQGTYVVGGSVNKTFGFSSLPGRILLRDTSYSDSATFKTAATGVLLYYELATPEEYILDNPPQYNYRVDDFSTEETVPSYDSANIIAPLAYDVQYAMNAVDAIRRLPDNYVERSNVKQTRGQSEEDVLSQKAVDDSYAKKVGVEENLVVGAAKALAGNQQVSEAFTTTVMSGADGLAKINDVRGKSLVWNNKINITDTSFHYRQMGNCSITQDGRTFTLTQNENTTKMQFRLFDNDRAIPIGHKVFVSFAYKTARTDCRPGFSAAYGVSIVSSYEIGFYLPASDSAFTRYHSIWLVANNLTEKVSGISFYCNTGDVENTLQLKDIVMFDLTLMFGAGNEPATVEEFEALFPLPYYDYNAGEIISNKTEQVKVVGFNQWDEEWESGAYNNGVKINTNTRIRCKNPIPCFPSTAYRETAIGEKSNTTFEIHFLDATGNYISKSNVTNETFTTPDNCYSFVFCSATNYYGVIYNHDICINLSDPAKNGTYEPYKTNTIELNIPTLTGKVNGEGESVVIASDGLKSAGSVYDEGIVENGYLTKIVKRIGVVDIGTLNWVYESTSQVFYAPISNAKLYTSSMGAAPQINTKGYVSVYAITRATDKSIAVNTSGPTTGRIYIKDSAYTDAATFKTAMSGVMLYYELAEPITYVLDTPIPATFQSYKGGTLKQIPENGSVPTTAPHSMSVTYAIDAAGILTGLPQNYVSKESLQAMLMAMQSAGIFSAYTMTYNATTGKYEFTFTPNA